LFLEVFKHALVPGLGFGFEEALGGGEVFGGCRDAFVEEGDIVRVHGVGVHAVFGEGGEREAEAEAVGCEAFVTFGEAFEERAELDVNFRGAFDAQADGVEGFREAGREAVFEVGGEQAVGEFFGDGDGGSFAPDGEFLVLGD
jgi:hypothetical protein